MSAVMSEFTSVQRGTTVLVVEDDEIQRALIRETLEREGHEVHEAEDGRTALAAAAATSPGLVLLDVSLPGASGLEVLRVLRQASDVPVILVTGKAEESDRVLGLGLGADDYVVKPFYPRELAARVEALLRRSGRDRAPDKIEHGSLAIDLGSREITLAGEKVDCSVKEFDLLAFLAASPHRVHSREDLLHAVWGSSSAWQDPGTVTEHVRRLRSKLGDDADAPRWIVTVRGVGYRFEPDVAPQ